MRGDHPLASPWIEASSVIHYCFPPDNVVEDLLRGTEIEVVNIVHCKIWYQNAWHTTQVSATRFLYQFFGGELGSFAIGLRPI